MHTDSIYVTSYLYGNLQLYNKTFDLNLIELIRFVLIRFLYTIKPPQYSLRFCWTVFHLIINLIQSHLYSIRFSWTIFHLIFNSDQSQQYSIRYSMQFNHSGIWYILHIWFYNCWTKYDGFLSLGFDIKTCPLSLSLYPGGEVHHCSKIMMTDWFYMETYISIYKIFDPRWIILILSFAFCYVSDW